MAMVAVSSSPVSAASCTAQLGYSVAQTMNYNPNSNVGVIVWVLARCSSVNTQLYAIGNVHDVTANTDLPSASAVLATGFGLSSYTGQLVYNLSPNAVGDQLQVSVNVYSGQNNGQPGSSSLVTTSEIVSVILNTNYVNFGSCYYSGACDTGPNYCQSPGINSLLYNSTVQCVGYLSQDTNGCVELVIPVYSRYGFLTYVYYTLQNLPASYPPIGTWVAVTGQLQKESNVSPSGAACPGNYITLASIIQ
jgi:hypothetical protein